jgi:dTDP-4-amino-4,6-dideoxygalactose transaminase
VTTIPVMRPWMGAEEQQAVAEAVASGWVAQGPRVAAFEQAFRHTVGSTDAVAVSSCTTALHLALVALGVGPGDEVVVPSLSFIATANAVRYVGARPVFADVDPTTLDVTPETIDRVRTASTRAVIAVHQAGTPADIDAIHRLCDDLDIALVEDAACAIGSTYHGRRIGAHSDLVAFSFHPRKLVTTGEGGMLAVSSREVGARLRRLREHGMDVSAVARHAADRPIVEQYVEVGFNYRMTDVQAALGMVQLRRLDAMVARRRELAARYTSLLSELPVRVAADPPWGTTNFQSYWILLDPSCGVSQEQVITAMHAAGISVRRGVMAAHREPAYAALPLRGPLPVTEEFAAAAVILPLFHEMTDDQQDRVVEVLAEQYDRPLVRTR